MKKYVNNALLIAIMTTPNSIDISFLDNRSNRRSNHSNRRDIRNDFFGGSGFGSFGFGSDFGFGGSDFGSSR